MLQCRGTWHGAISAGLGVVVRAVFLEEVTSKLRPDGQVGVNQEWGISAMSISDSTCKGSENSRSLTDSPRQEGRAGLGGD